MGNIVVLDELTINKIAAGEVIERPASVIKEMVENSIDAGAKNISIDIKNGGISYIKITDDGKGIEKEDLELSFERHATSKIRNADDLNEVKSMGFRGEALASIAAIARVEMKTKTNNSEVGHRIVVEGGDVKEVEEIGCPNGTTITVENLFYNTPVRYKFLKKDYTETGYIEDVITRLALVNPDISFKLINAGKPIIQTTGDGDIKNVIYSIYGKSVASACLNVNYTYEGITISGVVGKPEIARSNRGNQIFFVNKRYIRDRILSNATEKAFKGMIPIGKFGFLVLNLEMSPSTVDVNVHPAKLEVRFEEEQKVFKAVYYAIQDTLLKAELIANSETQITGKLEKEKNEDSEQKIEKREEIIPEEKNSISNLFRRISKSVNPDNDFGSNNVIESIFRSKQEKEIQKELGSNNLPENENNVAQNQEENAQEELKNDEESITENVEEPKAEIEDVQNAENIQNQENEQNDNMDNKEKIKNTIQELMQMGKSLTAEQIREKLSEISTKAEENIEEFVKEEYTQVSEEEEKYKVDDINVENNENADSADEKYETKEIDVKEIEKFAEDPTKDTNVSIENQESDSEAITPGNILADIVKERNKEDVEEKKEEKSFEQKFDDMYAQIFGKTLATKKKEEEEKANSSAQDIVNENINILEEEDKEQGKIPYKFIGIAFNTYIILEIKDELYILDQHAAHERIMYEKVKENYYSEGEKNSQLMLLPDIITLTHKEMDIARDNFDKFEKAGFVLEEFGENTIKLTGVPNICLDLDTKELFLETLDEINTVARTAKQEIEERFIATIACKAAVKANMALTEEEVTTLLEQLLKLPNPFTCPHGRPTAIKLSKSDIEKKFARRK